MEILDPGKVTKFRSIILFFQVRKVIIIEFRVTVMENHSTLQTACILVDARGCLLIELSYAELIP